MTRSVPLEPEGIVRIETGGAIGLIITLSLCVAAPARDAVGHMNRCDDGLVRIRYRLDGPLHAKTMRGFRAWLVDAYPQLADASLRATDDRGGLNIEGLLLHLNPTREASCRSGAIAVTAGRISVLCV